MPPIIHTHCRRYVAKFLATPDDWRVISQKVSSGVSNQQQMNYVSSKYLRSIQVSGLSYRMMSTIRQTVADNLLETGQSISEEQEKLLSSPDINKQVRINTCGELYAELSRTRPILFGSTPRNIGIDFDVQYCDTMGRSKGESQLNESQIRTVCLLHGAPGHYKDYASLINYLADRNIRVIAPNFPDYSATMKYSFRHSPRERADYLIEFFKTIQVTRLDLVIGHSSAVYTMFQLLERSLLNPLCDPKLEVKSLGLFSTPSYDLPKNLMVTPFRLFTLKLFDSELFRPLMRATIESFVNFQGIRNRVDKNKLDDLLIAASAVGFSDHEKMRDRLKLLSKYQIPVMMNYGTNDRLIPTSFFHQLVRDLGVDPECGVRVYNSDGTIREDSLETNHLVQASQFESGGHYTFQRFSKQVNNDVHRFLFEKVIREQYRSKL